MVAGRKPVTAEVRRRRGEPGRPLPVVVGGRTAPKRPPHLTPDMRAAWRFIVTDLMAADAIDHADAGVLEAAAVFWGRARQARSAMQGQDLIVESSQGEVPNRLLDIERQSWKEFRALAESLPLSPWGRARLGLKARPAADQVEQDIGLPPRLRVVAGVD
jgi:P27 family predicted phage terminase small subunit